MDRLEPSKDSNVIVALFDADWLNFNTAFPLTSDVVSLIISSFSKNDISLFFGVDTILSSILIPDLLVAPPLK